MKILLEKGKPFYVVSDQFNFSLMQEKEKNVKNPETGKVNRVKFLESMDIHFPTLLDILIDYKDRELRTSNISTFDGYFKKLKEHAEWVKDIYKTYPSSLREMRL